MKKVFLITVISLLVLCNTVFGADFILTSGDVTIKKDSIVIEEDGNFWASIEDFAVISEYSYSYDSDIMMATFSKENDFYATGLNWETYLKNNKKFALPNKNKLIEGKLFVDINVIKTIFDIDYEVDAEDKKLIIEDGMTIPESLIYKNKYTDEEIYLLAKLVDYEARGQSLVGRIAVANVVLNRVESPNFPNTISEVIYAKRQFPPAYYKSFKDAVPTEKSLKAVKLAMYGFTEAPECLFFNNRPFTSKNILLYKYIEGNYFYQSLK